MKDFSSVNLHHPQQDVHGTRRERTGHIRYQVAEQLLPSNLPQTAHILDIGCGRSEFARRLQNKGYQVTVTDLSPSNVQFAQSLGFPAHQVNLNDGLHPFESSQFNGVILLEVIEHIVKAEHLLQEIYRVLEPGGIIILSTPNFAFWQNRLRILMGNLSVDEGYHYRFFTVKSLAKQLTQAGFQAESWRFTMPAFGLNRLRRWFNRPGRRHLMVSTRLAPLLAQTMVVRGRK